MAGVPALKDTSPEVEALVRERMMKFSGAERFRIGAEMFEAARRMAMASLPGGLSERQRKALLYERVYGEKLPHDPAAER